MRRRHRDARLVKTVRYRAYVLRVPATWPVFRLASDPSACVRFDRHAVYLGRPSAEQRCPAHAVGRTEAILVEPLTAIAARSGRAAGVGAAPVLPEARTSGARGSIGQVVVPDTIEVAGERSYLLGIAVRVASRSERGAARTCP